MPDAPDVPRLARWSGAPLWGMMLGLLAACGAHIGDPVASEGEDTRGGGAASGSAAGGAAGTGGAPPTSIAGVGPGTTALRRLSRGEYDNTVRDLLGTKQRPGAALPADDTGYGFDNNADVQRLSVSHFEQYDMAAEALVDEALGPVGAASGARAAILSCDPTTGKTCVRQILSGFGKRAFRRPVTPDEVTRLEALAATATTKGDGAEVGIKLALRAMLSSPHFLFRVEETRPSQQPGKHPLSSYELASRLSYFIYGSMPDAPLFAAADQDALNDPAELEKHAARMLTDPKADDLVQSFAGQWLGTRGLATHETDKAAFPAYDAQLRDAMKRETDLFFREILTGDHPLSRLLDADFTYVDERLAKHYGLQGVTGPSHVRVTLPKGSVRGGLLTHGSILTATSYPKRTSPVRRGKWVLEQLLCSAPPPPPPGVEGLDKKGAVSGSIRQIMDEHRKDPVCASCHTLMDPIGFGLEHFDAIGAYRTKDGAYPVDATGKLPDGTAFDGARALSAALAGDERLRSCATAKLYGYALGRGVTTKDDATYVKYLSEQLAKRGDRLRDLVALIVTSEPFRLRGETP